MPRQPLFDLTRLNLDNVEYGLEEIEEVNPQRYEFSQIDAVVAFLPEEKIAVARKDVRSDEFWVRGHIPGKPLLPGVLMLEAAAQLCSFYTTLANDHVKVFYGFAGIDEVRFRGTVEPGDTLFLLARPEVLTASRSLFRTQGIVGEKIVFEGKILGIRLR